MASMQSWHDECAAGRCDPVQARYWQEKPAEEFYLVGADPYQINNLINSPEQAAAIEHLREEMMEKMVETRDAGLIPEGMYSWLPGGRTVYDYVQSDEYPVERVLEAALLATSRDASQLDLLVELMDDPHPVIRYWAATGCLILGQEAVSAMQKLLELLSDSAADVRVIAAEALGDLGEVDAATRVLGDVLENGNHYEALSAITSLEVFARTRKLSGEQVKEMISGPQTEDAERIVDWIQKLPG
jgi:hypothetical protein